MKWTKEELSWLDSHKDIVENWEENILPLCGRTADERPLGISQVSLRRLTLALIYVEWGTIGTFNIKVLIRKNPPLRSWASIRVFFSKPGYGTFNIVHIDGSIREDQVDNLGWVKERIFVELRRSKYWLEESFFNILRDLILNTKIRVRYL